MAEGAPGCWAHNRRLHYVLAGQQSTSKTQKSRDSGGVTIYLLQKIMQPQRSLLSTSQMGRLKYWAFMWNLVLIVVYRQTDGRSGMHLSTSAKFHQALGAIKDTMSNLPSPLPDPYHFTQRLQRKRQWLGNRKNWQHNISSSNIYKVICSCNTAHPVSTGFPLAAGKLWVGGDLICGVRSVQRHLSSMCDSISP